MATTRESKTTVLEKRLSRLELQVGYNEEEIRSFIPAARRIARSSCPNHLEACTDACNDGFAEYIREMENNKNVK